MKLSQWKAGADPEQRTRVRNQLKVMIAAIGSLTAVAGICICIDGLLYFDDTKVIAGACVIVISTITYIVMLTRAD